ncbi:MAG TPA: sugar transferase [Candidatus Paceibacterota bacterium]
MNYPLWKRIEDILGALAGMLLILPLAPFIILAIKLEHPEASFIVRLPRISEGRIIYVYKFRNMVPEADKMKDGLRHLNERNDGPFFKIANDPRVTKVGRILRKFRIDEFPQLINVLKGELSLVGPRPHEEEEIEKYPNEYKLIAKSRAGVTGLSQVNGASSLPFLKEVELDKFYIDHVSLWIDVKILFKTLSILFSDPNAV